MRSVAAAAATSMPARVEPVIETIGGVGCETSARPVSRSPQTTLNTPGGRNSAAISASSSVEAGVVSDGLSTTVLPAASAGRDLPDRHHQRVVPRASPGRTRRSARAGRRTCGRPCTRRPTCPRAAGRRRRRSGSGRRPAGSPRSSSARSACRCSGSRPRRTPRRAPRSRRRSAAAPAAARTGWCRARTRTRSRPRPSPRRRRRRRRPGRRRTPRRCVGSIRSAVPPSPGVDVLAVDEVAQSPGHHVSLPTRRGEHRLSRKPPVRTPSWQLNPLRTRGQADCFPSPAGTGLGWSVEDRASCTWRSP